MNLLSNAPNSDSSLRAELVEALENIGVNENEMKIAREFFDFSREIDISLLDNLHSRAFMKEEYTESANFLIKYWRRNDTDIVNRYILFVEALMGSVCVFALYFKNNFIYSMNNQSAAYLDFVKALRLRYGEEELQIKLCAICAETYEDTFIESKYLVNIAQSSPKILFNAFKNDYCISPYANPRITLCALALAFNPPQNGKLSPAECSDMVSFINKVFMVCMNSNNSGSFGFIMTAMFMSLNHNSYALNHIRSSVNGKESRLLNELLENVPETFFIENVEAMCEAMSLNESDGAVRECMKLAALFAWCGKIHDVMLERKAKAFLAYCTRSFTWKYVELMFSKDEVRDINLSRGGCIYPQERFYCCYYGDMYGLLKEQNPRAITEFGLNYNADIMRLTLQTECMNTFVAKTEIEQYLSGKAGLSVLEPYFDSLWQNFGTGSDKSNDRIVSLCMNAYPSFKKGYYTLKAFQDKLYIKMQISCLTGSDKRKEFYNWLIETLNEEGVSTAYRFNLYDEINLKYFDDLGDTILENMIARKDKYGGEYKSYCPDKNDFIRKIYGRYLVATNAEGGDKSEIFDMLGDSHKEVRKAMIDELAAHKEYESDVIALLKAKKSAVREAAVDILAVWGAESYREIFTEAADKEKSAKLADKIRDMLSLEKPKSEEENSLSPAELVVQLHKGGRNKKLLWLYETPVPTVHFKDGSEADDKYMQAIMICYSSMSTFGVSDKANILADELNENELNAFASEIFSRWLSDGAESKKKWVLNFTAVHGGNELIDVFLHYIKEWSENLRGAIAGEAVKALAMNGSSQALMAVDSMAHKFKRKQVKAAAAEAMEGAAEALGITSDELGDRLVPDLGFDENMQRTFDYGARSFKVYLTPTLELEIFGENDKKLKNLPASGKNDDEELAARSNAEFKALKRQLKNVVSFQKMRLETVLLTDRKWSKSAWEALFVRNPVMHSFAIGLIWASYENGSLSQTFRYMEDGSFNTVDEDEYILPENAVIGLVHPIDIDEETVSAWKEQLKDYEITQPIKQLGRPVYRILDKEMGELDLERFEGREINSRTLLSRTAKYGWEKGPVLDGSCFYTFYREDIERRVKNADGSFSCEGTAVELNFDGMYPVGDDSDVKIMNVRFYTPRTVKHAAYSNDYADDSKAIKLNEINPRYFSEIINQLEEITKQPKKK